MIYMDNWVEILSVVVNIIGLTLLIAVGFAVIRKRRAMREHDAAMAKIPDRVSGTEKSVEDLLREIREYRESTTLVSREIASATADVSVRLTGVEASLRELSVWVGYDTPTR